MLLGPIYILCFLYPLPIIDGESLLFMVISDGPRVVISGYFSCSKLVISDFAELTTLP